MTSPKANSLTLKAAYSLGIKRVEIVQAQHVSQLFVRCHQGNVYTLPNNEKLSIALGCYARARGLADSGDLVGLTLELVEHPDKHSRWPRRWRICENLSEGNLV